MNKQEKEVYQKTIEMYNGLCALCGNNQIQLHHIRYRRIISEEEKHICGNVIPLCKYHHDLVHTNKKKYMPLLIEMIDKKIGDTNGRMDQVT